MAAQIVPIQNAASVEDLQTECNFIELNLPGRLQSLRAVDNDGEKVTHATCDRLTDVEDGLGELEFTEDEGSENTAWINGESTGISFSGPEEEEDEVEL